MVVADGIDLPTSFLSNLNPAQLQAVRHDPQVPVQILAGPGSGKTKVLTSRVAYLILAHSMPPSSICAVTFTNKAANEMKERLTKLVGEKCTRDVRMGTFHGLCAMFLRKYGNEVGLKPNFTICDADESKKIVSTLLKPYQALLEEKHIVMKATTVISLISKAKAKRDTAADYMKKLQANQKSKTPFSDIDFMVAEIYEKYEQSLRQNNSLDFDDLLLYGVELFTRHKYTAAWCKHVLVDEFQDTNYTQYELMTALALHKCVTIVGDPDQSIYGWRSAEVENLEKMRKDFNGTKQIFLEQNYRSTAAILNASLAIIAQDESRIQKSLHTSHPTGMRPVLRFLPTEHGEATFIAGEIKRLVAQMGGVLRWGDFAVLLRFNALSRTIESALQRESIPSRILGGHKFFERLEIKNLLAYLQLIDNPDFDPALVRSVNVPSRGIGEKTLLELANKAAKMKKPQSVIVEDICDGKLPDIKPPIKQKLVSFVKAVRTLRDLAEKGTSPADLIRRLLDLVDFESHLRKTQPDWESRWENVQELITFASEVEADKSTVKFKDNDINTELSIQETPLRLFLQASMLSSEGDSQHSENDKDKVTITTCHAAKGLEWPVVMIPAVEQGTFPFYRSEDIGEERRLLYVACTRAQGLLYMTFVEKRKVAGDTKVKEISEFVSAVVKKNSTLFDSSPPNFSSTDRNVISDVLNRPLPDELEVSRRITEFNRTMHHEINAHAFAARHPFIGGNLKSIDFTASSNSSINYPRYRSGAAPIRSSDDTPNLCQPSNILVKETLASENIMPCQDNPPVPTTPMRNTCLTAAIPQTLYGVAPDQPTLQLPGTASIVCDSRQGAKRRLGMGRGVVGYANKKFKVPT